MSEPRTDTERALNMPGTVTLGDRLITVASLTARGERALYGELSAIVAAESDPFQRVAPVLARLERDKKVAERSVLLEVVARMVATGEAPSGEIVMAARRSNPRVVALELYRRAKPFHPELLLEELTAVITSVNAPDVAFDMENALGTERDDPKAIR